MEGEGKEIKGGAGEEEKARPAKKGGRLERRLNEIQEKVDRTDARLATYEEITRSTEEKDRREEEEIKEEVSEEIAAENPADKTGGGANDKAPVNDESTSPGKKDFFDWG